MSVEPGSYAKLTRDLDCFSGTFKAGTLVKVTSLGHSDIHEFANVVMRDERKISGVPLDALRVVDLPNKEAA